MRKILMRTADSAIVWHDLAPADLDGCHVDRAPASIVPIAAGQSLDQRGSWEVAKKRAKNRARAAQEKAMLDKFAPVASPMTTEVPPTDPLKKEVWDRLIADGVEPEPLTEAYHD